MPAKKTTTKRKTAKRTMNQRFGPVRVVRLKVNKSGTVDVHYGKVRKPAKKTK